MNELIGFFVSVFLSAFSSAAAKPVSPDAAMEIQSPKAAPAKLYYNFEHDAPGTVPKGWRMEVIGSGAQTKWEIKTDSHAPSYPNVLAQTGHTDAGPNFAALFLTDEPSLQDADISMKFKAVSGETQGGGMVYRYQDPQTYYVLWADANNDMLTLLRNYKGKLKSIDSKQVIISANIWHPLRLIFLLNTYRVYVDDEMVMAGKDKHILTSGRFGLVTRQDAGTYFDDVALSPVQAITAPKKP